MYEPFESCVRGEKCGHSRGNPSCIQCASRTPCANDPNSGYAYPARCVQPRGWYARLQYNRCAGQVARGDACPTCREEWRSQPPRGDDPGGFPGCEDAGNAGWWRGALGHCCCHFRRPCPEHWHHCGGDCTCCGAVSRAEGGRNPRSEQGRSPECYRWCGREHRGVCTALDHG